MKYLVMMFFIFTNSAWAIDNPEAPNYVAEFEARMTPLEDYIHKQAVTTSDYSNGYSALYDALDKELDLAYAALMAKLSGASREKMRVSQQRWIAFRDSEFSFITENFNRTDFGSSSSISRGSYRAAIVKARIEELLLI